MNKKISLFLVKISIFMLVFSNVSIVNATTKEDNSDIKVKNVICQYFENELRTMSLHIPIDSSTIISNKYLKRFNILRTNLIAEWYKEIDEVLKDYELYLDYDSITFNNNICQVNVVKGSDLIFQKSPKITQMSRNERHIIVLNNSNNEWKIEKDIYDEEFEPIFFFNLLTEVDELYNDELNKKIEILKQKKKNIKSEANKLKKEYILRKKIHPKSSYAGYDGEAARDYAYTYWENYNKDYSDWSSKGGDCTNFVSQCIKAGGIPTDNVWFKDSDAWIRVIELRNWLLDKGYASEYDWQSNSKVGDIIQLYNKSFSSWTHSMIISYKDPYGNIYISSHDSNRYNYALTNCYPSSGWTNIRFLKITN